MERKNEGWYCTDCNAYHGNYGYEEGPCEQCGGQLEYHEIDDRDRHIGHNED